MDQSESDSDTEHGNEIRVSDDHFEDKTTIIKEDKPLFKPQEPKDKYFLAFFIFYLLGMTTLIPWNFFITADDVSCVPYGDFSYCTFVLVLALQIS